MRFAKGLVVVLVLAAMHRGACADEFTDCMGRALALYEKGDFIAAQKELTRATEILAPRATAQIPPATVKGSTYINYEQSFRISGLGKDWVTKALTSQPTGGAVTTLATISYIGNKDAETIIFYVRDLRAFLGQRYESIIGHEPEVLRAFGEKTSTFVRNLTDCSKPTHTEHKVAGKPAVSSEYTAKRDGTAMHCLVLQVLVGEKVFTGIFISTEANWDQRSKDFANIINTISFDVPMPERVLMPPDPPADPQAGKTE